MKKDILAFLKVINGIYMIAVFIWILFLLISLGEADNRTLLIILLFMFSTQIGIFICSLIFYFVTKSILTISEQIKYGLIILLASIDLFFISGNLNSDNSILIFIALINILPLLYLLRNNINKKAL